MRCTITETSLYAMELLRQQPTGFVHSVYRKTVNLRLNGSLLALQVQGSPLSPLSLITNLADAQMDALGIQAGQPVAVRQQSICICENAAAPIAFDCSDCVAEDLRLHTVLSDAQQHTLTASIRRVLSQTSTNGFDLLFHSRDVNADSLIHTAAKNNMERALSLYQEGAWHEAADALCRLIGLGIGLTPSGDDFLCGVLAGATLFGNTDAPFYRYLRQTVPSYLDRTNDISRAFVACACSGLFSRAVCSLQALPQPDEIYRMFSAIGHSSGIDTLCGIYFSYLLDHPSGAQSDPLILTGME